MHSYNTYLICNCVRSQSSHKFMLLNYIHVHTICRIVHSLWWNYMFFMVEYIFYLSLFSGFFVVNAKICRVCHWNVYANTCARVCICVCVCMRARAHTCTCACVCVFLVFYKSFYVRMIVCALFIQIHERKRKVQWILYNIHIYMY